MLTRVVDELGIAVPPELSSLRDRCEYCWRAVMGVNEPRPEGTEAQICALFAEI